MGQKSDLSFIRREHLPLIEELYQTYLTHPETLESSWRHFFQGVDFASSVSMSDKDSDMGDARVFRLIHAYRAFGHKVVAINPIALENNSNIEELKLERYGFSQQDLGKEFSTFGLLKEKKAKLELILKRLQDLYCGRIGFEYMDIQDVHLRDWIQNRVESSSLLDLDIEAKRRILKGLNQAELFETFLHTKFVGQKRFSLEGLETLIPVLSEILNHSGRAGVNEAVFGMAHRGRLSVLANILKKSYSIIFHEFEEAYAPGDFEGSGDVKYHKGFSSDMVTDYGDSIHLSIAPNTSHLDSVDGIVLGQVRAKQVLKEDHERTRILPILIHGDAALSGQGIIYEVMQFSGLEGYGTGGCIHVVLDNQVGFTTLPKEGRSTFYCTDIARAFNVPVFHVNAEDPEACVEVCKLAVEIRQKFHQDVYIHLSGYRKYGHNESDEPFYTQPLEYKVIAKKKSIRANYTESLINQGIVEKKIAIQLESEFRDSLQHALEGTKEFLIHRPSAKEILGNRWDVWKEFKLQQAVDIFKPIKTALPIEHLKELIQKIGSLPEGFEAHRKIRQLFQNRLKILDIDEQASEIDWGLAEHLAFASILCENKHIRISGQDSRRGTFSHRHAYIVDQQTSDVYAPLANLQSQQGLFHCYNSPLSEYGVLAFEYGYSISYRDVLVIWEAQFGDFSNGAQIIIDGYIATAEQKWNRLSGLTLFLPHGYEGQGPEHSSTRIERFLQLSGQDNMFIINPSTPAQLYHLLRRKSLQPFRKPLIVFTPKRFLRHKSCVSSLSDLASGQFHEVLDDPRPPKKCKKLVLCTGRVYYDLEEVREQTKNDSIAIIRIEQLYPLHRERILEICRQYKGYEELIWLQEEPENMGAWDYIRPFLREELNEGKMVKYIGREWAASPATGSHLRHEKEREKFLKELFG